MKHLVIVLLGLEMTTFVAHAATSFDPPYYEMVGEVAIQQIGNTLIGEYRLNRADTSNSYDVLNPVDGQMIGEFQLAETRRDGFFELEPAATPGEYELVEPFHPDDYDFGQITLPPQGHEITGNYRLAVDPPDPTPEPGVLVLSLLGIGCLAAVRLRNRPAPRRI